jgi:hypothetical protein
MAPWKKGNHNCRLFFLFSAEEPGHDSLSIFHISVRIKAMYFHESDLPHGLSRMAHSPARSINECPCLFITPNHDPLSPPGYLLRTKKDVLLGHSHPIPTASSVARDSRSLSCFCFLLSFVSQHPSILAGSLPVRRLARSHTCMPCVLSPPCLSQSA